MVRIMSVPLEIQGTRNFVEAEGDETCGARRRWTNSCWMQDGFSMAAPSVAPMLREDDASFNMKQKRSFGSGPGAA
jgi:hypothetical protein